MMQVQSQLNSTQESQVASGLQTQINNEIIARQSADIVLQDQITTSQFDVNTLKNQMASTGLTPSGLQTQITSVKAQQLLQGDSIQTLQNQMASTQESQVASGLQTQINNIVSSSSANNINGGNTNQVLYQTAANTTGFINAPQSGYKAQLMYDGTNFYWMKLIRYYIKVTNVTLSPSTAGAQNITGLTTTIQDAGTYRVFYSISLHMGASSQQSNYYRSYAGYKQNGTVITDSIQAGAGIYYLNQLYGCICNENYIVCAADDVIQCYGQISTTTGANVFECLYGLLSIQRTE